MSERLDGGEPAREGTSIGERYRIERAIGRGGMGVVYSARHELTRRPVAIKLLIPWHSEHTSSFELLLNEARSAAGVRHANIVDVLDMGVHDGTPFLVMELLDGSSLEAAQPTGLPVAQVLAWLIPIMGALALLHDHGIVHGDVKPSNIFLAGTGDARLPKLLDFGLARAYDAGLASGQLRFGTRRYMAPEHAAGQPVEAQADVWSMGVVLRECLTDLPEPLARAIAGALEPELSKRHPTMRAFVLSVVQAAARCGVRLPLDPDPVALPEFPTWLLMETDDAALALTRSVEHDQSLAPTDALPSELVETGSRAGRKTRPSRRWLAGAALASLLVALSARSASSGSAPARSGHAARGARATAGVLAAASAPVVTVPSTVSADLENLTRTVEPAPSAHEPGSGTPARVRRAKKTRSAANVALETRDSMPDDLEPIETEW